MFKLDRVVGAPPSAIAREAQTRTWSPHTCSNVLDNPSILFDDICFLVRDGFRNLVGSGGAEAYHLAIIASITFVDYIDEQC